MAQQKSKIKKILVTGSNGQLGKAIKFYYKTNNKYSIYFKNKNQLNISNSKKLDHFVSKNNIKIIINLAAFTNVDKAEIEIKKAYLINSKSTQILSNIANKYDAILIHFSTDYVFEGKGNNSYKEDHITKPISIYGKSKLDGEKKIINICKKFIIIRIAWLYGPFGNNFFTKVITKYFDKKKYEMISNQFSYPASSLQLAKDILKIINLLIKNPNEKKYYGIFHYGPYQHKITRFDFVNKLSNILLKYKKEILIDKSMIINKFVKLSKNIKSDIRPSNSMLNNNKFFKTFKLKKYTFKNNLELSISLYINKILK